MSRFTKLIHRACIGCTLLSLGNLDAKWQNQAIVSPFNSDVSNGIDDSGNATTVWLETSSIANHIYSATLPKEENSNWLGVETLLSKDSVRLESIKIAVASDGNAIVIWQEWDDGQTKVRASTKPFKGKWSEPVDLGIGSTKYINTSADVSISRNGYAVAVWASVTGIQTATYNFDGTWANVVDIGVNGNDPKIKLDKFGNAVAVWHTDGSIQSSCLPYRGQWTPAVKISNQDAGHPQLAMNAAGFAVASWTGTSNQSSIVSLYAATLKFGQHWSTPALVCTADLILEQKLAIDAQNRTILVWGQKDITENVAYPTAANKYLQAAEWIEDHWSRPHTISGQDSVLNHCLAIDNDGNALAVWNTYSEMKFTTHAFGSYWTMPETIATGNYGLISKPQLALESPGYAVLNWVSESCQVESAQWIAD